MSIRRVTNGRSVGRQQPIASNANLGVSTGGTAAQWTRPSEWLPLADVTGSQRFSGLFAIYPDGNFLALSAAGAYTVDWGDGTVENFASGAVARREYTYANISSTNESTLGYRQVVVQVYPQSGQNLTTLNLQQRHNQAGLNTTYATPWLDIAVNGANLTSLSIGGSTTPLRMLRQATIYSHAVTNMSAMFNACPSLQSVPLFNTAAVTSMVSMFASCPSLRTVPLFNTAAVTNMGDMFGGCTSLQSVPLFNTAAVTSMGGMFNGCSSLQSVPLFNTAAVTNMGAMFQSCTSLQSVPLFNTAAVTSMGGMFNGCSSLQSVPLFNTAAVTNMSAMFASCRLLQTVPLFNTAAVTNMGDMFNGCTTLQSVPLFNTAAVTNMAWMFNACSSLQSVPLFNTAAVTSMAVMFQSCTTLQSVPLFNTAAVTNMANMLWQCPSLQSVPLFNTAAVTNMSAMFSNSTSLQSVAALNAGAVTSGNFAGAFTGCPSLVRCQMTNINQTISFANCKLSAAEINAIFNNLSSTGSGKTITVTGNYGAATCNTSLATAKGWTVAT